MIFFRKKYLLTVTGTVLGGIAGFFYWRFVGCTSGTCYIQSNPYRMSAYAALIGGLLFSSFNNSFSDKNKKAQ
ncbi:MAG TPA: hypothetical protein VKT28_09800 [Puia sp.]|nr:hypothetical protein [Puia sp.]